MTDTQNTLSQQTPIVEPAIIVVFGITGDLAQRYLLPALYHLIKDNLLDEHTEIVGLTRQAMTSDDLFQKVDVCINEIDGICDSVAFKAMREKTRLVQFDPSVVEDYNQLRETLQAIETSHGVCMNRLFYLSIPPKLFNATVSNLGQTKLNESCEHGKAHARLLVEKPFGNDSASAQTLISETNAVFQEAQVFRIDHYLAKETVQNILTFRAQNPIFASIWDNQHVQTIDIVAREKIGIEGRVQFYEGVGALRDLIQSHLLQLLAVTTMQLPLELTSDSIHQAKQALLGSVLAANPEQARRGQYDSYRQEVSNDTSMTETFASLSLKIDTENWRDVPITITTGKALAERKTEIRVAFVDKRDGSKAVNQLIFRIQPNEGIHLQLRVKKPGFEHTLQDAVMDFSYQETFGDSTHPNAYERVLVDAVKGDRTLFATSEEVLQSWRIIEPVLKAWQQGTGDLIPYTSGSEEPVDKP